MAAPAAPGAHRTPAPAPAEGRIGTGPVRQGTDTLTPGGAVEAFPAVRPAPVTHPAPVAPVAAAALYAPAAELPVQRAMAAPVPAHGAAPGYAPVPGSASGAGTSGTAAAVPGAPPAVPLGPVRSVDAAELPVQRAPATPSLGDRLAKFVSPQRPSEPRVTSVTVGRDTSGGGTSSEKRPAGKTTADPPPPYSPPAYGPPPSYSVRDTRTGPPGGGGGNGNGNGNGGDDGTEFDARTLSDGQVDELTHRLIGPLTRLLRTELRLDRERIGRLRDSRR
jgi:hypothetical protein